MVKSLELEHVEDVDEDGDTGSQSEHANIMKGAASYKLHGRSWCRLVPELVAVAARFIKRLPKVTSEILVDLISSLSCTKVVDVKINVD